MKKIIILNFLIVFGIIQLTKAQTVLVMPDSTAPNGTFTEWKSVSTTDNKGNAVTYDYRVAFMKRTGIACNYSIQLKNTSKVKFKKILIKYEYYDKLVKSNFAEVKSGSAKPGATVALKFPQQGCKKDKGAKDSPDNITCSRCPLVITVDISN